MAEMLEKIWENREHNFLLDKVKCTKLEVEEDAEESIDDLFGSEEFLAEDFEDEEVFNAMNLHRMILIFVEDNSIPIQPTQTKCLVEKSFLLLSWIYSVFICFQHSTKSSIF